MKRLRKVGLNAEEYETLAASPLSQRTQEEEMKLAYLEGRQPYCIHCQQPLYEVLQEQYETISWKWNERAKAFGEHPGNPDRDKPYCASCEMKDWDYIDFNMVNF